MWMIDMVATMIPIWAATHKATPKKAKKIKQKNKMMVDRLEWACVVPWLVMPEKKNKPGIAWDSGENP